MNPNEPAAGVGGNDKAKSGQVRATLAYRVTLVDSPPFWISLSRQLRDRLHERRIVGAVGAHHGARHRLPLTEMSPWYRDLPNQLQFLLEKPKSSQVALTSTPIEVPDIWRDYRMQPASWMNAVMIHALVVLALALPFVMSHPRRVDAVGPFKPIFEPYVNIISTKAGTGLRDGGGGKREPKPASIGAIPKFAANQIAPPAVMPLIANPILKVTPTLVGSADLHLPQMAVHLPWGDPNGVPGPPSSGPGSGDGIGTGDGTGVGPGNGASFGTDNGNGYPIYRVGVGGVTAPQPIFNPSPDYSEQARKAKHQGRVVLSLVVDPQGNPVDIHVIQSLGMGLDEKAVDKVRTWKFNPGKRNDVPVAVRVLLEITFRLF